MRILHEPTAEVSEDDTRDHDHAEDVHRKADVAADSAWRAETDKGRDARFEGDP